MKPTAHFMHPPRILAMATLFLFVCLIIARLPVHAPQLDVEVLNIAPTSGDSVP